MASVGKESKIQKMLFVLKEPQRFTDLRKSVGLTDMGLLKNLKSLEKAGLVYKDEETGRYRLTDAGIQALENQNVHRNIDLGLEVRRLFFILKDLYAFWLAENPKNVEIKDFSGFIPLPLSDNDALSVDDFFVDRNSLDNLDILIAKLEHGLNGMLPLKLLEYQKPSLNNPSTDALRLELWTLKVYTYEKGTTTFKFEPDTFCSPRICAVSKLAELNLPDELKSLVLDGLNYLKDFAVKYTLYFNSTSNPLGDEFKC